jgi:hypothetical protein
MRRARACLVLAPHPGPPCALQVIQQVVAQDLRPQFPPFLPPAYVALAQRCWARSTTARPSFEEVAAELQEMVQQAEALQHNMEHGDSSFQDF